MDNNTIIEKIKIAEEIAKTSKLFPEKTYQIILSFLLSKDNYTEIKTKKRAKANRAEQNKKLTKGLGQKINVLISDGFFDSAKTSKEIIAKLKIMGYRMKSTSLPSYLLPKVRNQELKREEIETKNGKIYGYIRKNK